MENEIFILTNVFQYDFCFQILCKVFFNYLTKSNYSSNNVLRNRCIKMSRKNNLKLLTLNIWLDTSMSINLKFG